MNLRSVVGRLALQEDLNFLLTNRIPRTLATRLVGRIGRSTSPFVRRPGLAIWKLFADLELDDAAEASFPSLHACFTRALRPGARPIDPDPRLLVSPCDAIVGACGRVDGTQAIQAKNLPYTLEDLLHDPELVALYRGGQYVTLRLSSSMYHRFHAPHDCRVDGVTYISGDTWNTNPITVRRVARLYCKNERAVIRTHLEASGHPVTLVAVASILVATIRLHFVDVPLHLRYRGPNVIPCDARFRKGEEMGWFELGSTILAFAPGALRLADGVEEGAVIRMGRPLFRLP